VRSPLAAVLIGALAGTFAAATVILTWALAILASWGIPPGAADAAGILGRTARSAGPCGLLLFGVLAWRLRRGVEAGRSRGRTWAMGVLGGVLLGLVALVPAMWLYGERGEIRRLFDPQRVVPRIALAASLVGGAVGGFACAWAVSRPKKS
jgi:hypothetical protein